MRYKYKDDIGNAVIDSPIDVDAEAFDELDEVYAKAKAWEKLKESEEYNIEKLFHYKAIGKTMDLLEGSTDFNDFIKGE